MKKLLFGTYSLDIGGIEKALVILVNKLQEKGYDITLVLEKKQGIFLNEIDPKIKIIEYAPSNSKNKIQRKIINLIKRIKFTLKYKNKYDFSASFATYSLPSSFVARTASKNCYLWGHADYLTLFDGNAEEMKEFFIERNYDKFKKIIFVSKEGKDSFIKVFPKMNEKTMVCNNLIDADKILELSKEKIPEDEGLNKINLNMNFCGLDLSKIPQQNLNDWTVYIIPALYIISTFISMKITTSMQKKSKKNDGVIDITEKEEKDSKEEEKNEMEDMMEQSNKMMSWMMPIMSVSISLVAPLGLALYWLVNNILMIGERLVLNKIIKD